MPHKIHSIIEVSMSCDNGGCSDMPNKHRKRRKNPDSDSGKPHFHAYKSEAVSDKNRFFHGVKSDNKGVTQTTNVTVNVEQQDDCLTSCFSGLAKCFGRGAKGAA